jgi:outer membrane protein
MNFTSGSRSSLAALALFFLAPISGVHAQGTAAAGAAPTKIAVLNVRNAIVATAEGKLAQIQLQSQFAPKQNDLQNTQKKIEDIQRRLNEGARTLSDDEKGKLQRQGDLLSRQLQRDSDGLNEELNAAQADIVDGIGRRMLDVLDRYSRENGYAVVLDTSAQGTPVVYGSSQIDVTTDIVRLYDEAYPVKTPTAGGAAAPPAAPKPAAPATPPPAKKAQ